MKKVQRITTRLSQFKIPFIIPKRSKGSFESLCTCTFTTSMPVNALLNPLDFISFFTPYVNTACNSDMLLNISKEIVKSKKLNFFNLKVDLFYHMDRVSATYKNIIYEMPSYHEIEFSTYKWFTNVGIFIPVRVKDITTVGGRLEYKLVNHNHQHFEDLLEHVQNVMDYRLYPIACSEDEGVLSQKIDKGKEYYEYLLRIKEKAIQKQYAKGGVLNLFVPDLYNMYEFNYEVEW